MRRVGLNVEEFCMRSRNAFLYMTYTRVDLPRELSSCSYLDALGVCLTLVAGPPKTRSIYACVAEKRTGYSPGVSARCSGQLRMPEEMREDVARAEKKEELRRDVT